MKARARGFILLEALVALTILGTAAATAAWRTAETLQAVNHVHAREAEVRAAHRLLSAVSLWPREDLDRHFGSRPQGRWTMQASTAAMALLLSPLAPTLVARRAESSLRAIQESQEWRLALDVLSQLQRATTVLAGVERFAASRPQRTRLLADLARVLPELTAIEALDARGDDVRLVLLTPDAAAALAAARALPHALEVESAGPVTRVSINQRELERIAVKLRVEHGARVAAAGEGR